MSKEEFDVATPSTSRSNSSSDESEERPISPVLHRTQENESSNPSKSKSISIVKKQNLNYSILAETVTSAKRTTFISSSSSSSDNEEESVEAVLDANVVSLLIG